MDIVVDLLAVRRIVRLVTRDVITEPIREAAEESGNELLSYFVTCESCVSVWASLVTLLIPRHLRRALALSEASILVGKVL